MKKYNMRMNDLKGGIIMEETRLWVVYVHINRFNGKAYVGITSREPEKRWGCNGLGYKPDKGENPNRHFWNAIQKYGWDNFSHKIIEENLTEDEANEFEAYYIEKFDSYNNGYNSTRGGGGVSGMHHSPETKKRMSESRKGKKHSKEWCERIRNSQICKRPVICLETQVIYNSPSECAIKLELNYITLLAVCRGVLLSTNGLHFQYAEEPIKTIDEIENSRLMSSQARAVKCLETGAFYKSINDCAAKTGNDRRNIQRACKMYIAAQGYHYKFADDDTTLEQVNERNIKHSTRKIRCVETSMIFNSLKECADFFGLKSAANISSVCNGRQKTYKGFHLEYYTDTDRRIKKVMCINDGRIFETQKECAEFYGINRSTLNYICNKRTNSFNGLQFRFVGYDVPEPIKGTKTETKKVICVENGQIYNSARECGIALNISPNEISLVLHGKRKSAKGYHFKYE